MKWSIQQLFSYRDKELHLDESVDAEELKQRDREIRDISEVQVQGHGSVSKDLATFILNISGKMILPCARTLNDVEYPFSIDAVESFQLSERATFDEDDDVHELTNNTVDLKPYVMERILLEKPLRVFSGEPTGPAPNTGEGWELQAEEESPSAGQKVDPRLAKLEDYFKNNE
ncbi:YceD family protein [Alkalicoccus saliphilus]|jgi:uncharacterized protein|uniref:DUF177 domain-containing protein n=1 Tax=Alkalicoccus saliphilus TaxID=200989 RepID=A0A2T4U8K1_9BACI|nr:YceD family protein [Alkalicoccus saliphilus]PTL39724.1 hypothetical protein C6Y45_05240 [Alkalicoccus saliphilus]